MTVARFAFVVCLAGLLISLMVAIVLKVTYASGASAASIFMMMHPAAKIGVIVLVPLALISTGLAVAHRLKRRRNNGLALALRGLAVACVAIGVGCALLTWSGLSRSLQQAGSVSFSVVAPSWVEIASVLALGFLPAVIALLGAAPVRVERRGL